MTTLFSKARLRLFVFERWLPSVTCAEKLAILRKLLCRKLDGSLEKLTETRVESSFTEQLFAELFEYRTLLRHGIGDYHLQPKFKLRVGAHRRYDDFALGFFGPKKSIRVASAELKSYGIPLDDVQPSYETTPVQQAFGAAGNATWVIVSDFDEIRLYRNPDQIAHERIFLTDVLTHDDIRLLCALFSRDSLLGTEGRESPLLRFSNGGHPMLINPHPTKVRLIHEARALDGCPAAPLHTLDDGLRSATEFCQQAWKWPDLIPGGAPEVAPGGDRLVLEHQGHTRVEMTKEGVLRVQEYVELEPHPALDGDSSRKWVGFFQPDPIFNKMASFVRFANRAMPIGLSASKVVFQWTLLDTRHAACFAAPGWIASDNATMLVTGEDTCICADPDPVQIAAVDQAVKKVPGAFREILFQFSHRRGPTEIVRVNPSEDVLARVLRRFSLATVPN